MSASARRVPSIVLAVLFLAPALGALVPSALAASGTELATDPVGDNPPDGADTDIVRFAASTDPQYVHFYIEVADISAIDEPNGYQVQFKGPQTQPTTFNVIAEYDPDGTFTEADMFKDTDPLGSSVPVGAAWKGDELRLSVRKIDIMAALNGKSLSALIAETFPMSTGLNVDQTAPAASYLVQAGEVSAPMVVTGLAGQGGSTRVDLTWTAPYNGGSTITAYNVYRGATSGSLSLLTTSATNSHGDTTVAAGASYVYAVSAVNSAGEGPTSAGITLTAVDPTVPTAVQALAAVAGDETVTLAWTPPLSDGGASLTGYRVHQGTVPGGESPLPGLVTGTSTVLTGLQNGQAYYFRVSAVNAVGDGPLGSEASATPSAAAAAPTFLTVADPSGRAYGEPTLGVHPVTGEILYQNGFDTLYAAADLSGAWADRSYPFNVASADPYGHMDEVTGRYWASQLLGECSTIGFTDDLGLTWDISQGCSTGGGIDHQTIGSGPWAGAKPAAATYDRSVYYCIQGSQTATCGVSLDGGITFGPGVAITSNAQCVRIYNMIHGHVRVGPDGTAYVPFNQCGDNQGIVFSKDNGITWTTYPIPGTTADMEFDPSVWATEDHVYYGYVGSNGRPWVAISNDATLDEASTWTHVDLGGSASPYDIQRTAFPTMVAGDGDRAAFTFLGTSSTQPTTTEATNAVWYAYSAITYDAGATWRVVDVAPGNIIQRGGICTGLNCGPHRNMLDFMDSTVGPKGEVVIALPDGCTTATCSGASGTYAQSRDTRANIALQTTGRTLYAAFDDLVTVPDAPVVVPASGSGIVSLAWTAPADGNSPISSYVVRRDGSVLATVAAPDVAYDDTTVTDGTTYSYTVAAVNSIGEGPQSAAVVVTPDVDLTPPSQVAGLLVASAGEGRVSLLWDPATDAHGIASYVVARDGADVGSVGSATTAFTDDGLQNNRQYGYTVRAVDNSANEGGASAAVLAHPLRQPTARFIAADPAGDTTNAGTGIADLRSFSFLTDATTVRLEWAVRDAAQLPGANKVPYFVADVVIGSLTYTTEYDIKTGGRCHAYHDVGGAGVVGIAGVCTTDGNKLTMVLDRADLEAQFVNGDPITLRNVASGTITLNPTTGAETGSVSNDAIVGTFTYAAGAPPSTQSPSFAAIPDATVAEDALLALTASATDPNGDLVTYSATGLPAGAAFDAQTGGFSWTPGFDQAGAYAVRLTASNGVSQADEDVTITVANVDRAPVLDPIGPQTIDEGDRLTLVLTATDPDGEAVSFTAQGLPAQDATFENGVFTWTTGEFDAGERIVTFTATSGSLSDSEAVAITVMDVPVNHAPVLDAIGDKAVAEGQPLAFQVTASDVDGDALTYTASALPPGATFDGATATFSWTPTFDDSGNYPGVTFLVTDGELGDTAEITISVGSVNRPPVLAAIGPKTTPERQVLTFTVSGSDPDGNPLTYAATGLPSGATFSASTRTFSWNPTFTQAGVYTPRFTVSDGSTTVGETVTITVTDTDRAPILFVVASASVYEGSPLSIPVTSQDQDGTTVTLGATGLPAGATLTPTQPNRATLAWTPAPGQAGRYTVTITGTSNGLTSAKTLVLDAFFHGGIALAQVTSPTVGVSPGQTLVLEATVTNDAAFPDVARLAVANGAGWAVNGPLPDVALAPGASALVSVAVTVPADGVVASPRLTATSAHDAPNSVSVTWALEVRLVLTLTPADETLAPADEPTGTVAVAYLDGTAARSIVVSVTQTPADAAALATSVNGVTNAAGLMTYTFGVDPRARTLGAHDLVARAKLVGGPEGAAAAAYVVTLA